MEKKAGREGRWRINRIFTGELIRHSETVRNPKILRADSKEVIIILVWHSPGPPLFSTHVLIQVIILPHRKKAGREGR